MSYPRSDNPKPRWNYKRDDGGACLCCFVMTAALIALIIWVMW